MFLSPVLMRSILITSRRATVVSIRRCISKPASSNSRRQIFEPSPPPEQSWLTRTVKNSPTALNFFLGVARVLGYGSAKQVAGRRAFGLYEQVCALRPDEEKSYWLNECYLPPTFQSWFTITNLHIWLLTVRLRALPPPHGPAYVQGLIDHFFLDVEDRIRAVLQPPPTPSEPYTFISSFYVNPNTQGDREVDSKTGKPKPRGRAPDRLVTQQMKIFKEQWAGMGMSFDLGLVKGDPEMAGAVWRNLLGARGARGITFDETSPHFRRSVNLVGGAVEKISKVDAKGLDTEESRDDGSGVYDFPPSEADKYVKYPEVMADLVGYLRRELVRLESIPDEVILDGDLDKLKFGVVREEGSVTEDPAVSKSQRLKMRATA